MGRSLLDSVAVYRVKVVDRATGAERFVNAEAASPEEAIEQVAAFGEMVGEAELVEVKRTSDATAPAPATPIKPTVVHVPVPRKGIGIGGVVVAIILALLLFPVVAIVLFTGGVVGLAALGAAANAPATSQPVKATKPAPVPRQDQGSGVTVRKLVHAPDPYLGKTIHLNSIEFSGLTTYYVKRFEQERRVAAGTMMGVTIRDDSGETMLTVFAAKDSDPGRELLSSPAGQLYAADGWVVAFEDRGRAALLLTSLKRLP